MWARASLARSTVEARPLKRGGRCCYAVRVAEADRERWDARYRGGGRPAPAGGFLQELDVLLPRHGRALDVACGRGALCLWLAQRGFEVTGVDVSAVALDQLRAEARARGLSIATGALDLETEPLPAGDFDLICCMHYRQPALVSELIARLSPGGVLAIEQHTVDNLALHARPSRRFLAERGELARQVLDADRPLRLERYSEGVVEGRAVARVLARAFD